MSEGIYFTYFKTMAIVNIDSKQVIISNMKTFCFTETLFSYIDLSYLCFYLSLLWSQNWTVNNFSNSNLISEFEQSSKKNAELQFEFECNKAKIKLNLI